MTYIKKVTIQGTNDIGEVVDIPIDSNQHLEAAIHSPSFVTASLNTREDQ